jgi:hypothetical protein
MPWRPGHRLLALPGLAAFSACAGSSDVYTHGQARLATLPFDHERRAVSVLVQDEAGQAANAARIRVARGQRQQVS